MDVLPKEIKDVIARYKAALKEAGFPSAKLFVFGSYARGEARKDSDLDICLVSSAFRTGRDRDRFRKIAVFTAFHTDPRIQVVLASPKEFRHNDLSPLFSHIRKEAVAA